MAVSTSKEKYGSAMCGSAKRRNAYRKNDANTNAKNKPDLQKLSRKHLQVRFPGGGQQGDFANFHPVHRHHLAAHEPVPSSIPIQPQVGDATKV